MKTSRSLLALLAACMQNNEPLPFLVKSVNFHDFPSRTKGKSNDWRNSKSAKSRRSRSNRRKAMRYAKTR